VLFPDERIRGTIADIAKATRDFDTHIGTGVRTALEMGLRGNTVSERLADPSRSRNNAPARRSFYTAGPFLSGIRRNSADGDMGLVTILDILILAGVVQVSNHKHTMQTQRKISENRS
jgi:hypothetical protein